MKGAEVTCEKTVNWNIFILLLLSSRPPPVEAVVAIPRRRCRRQLGESF